MEAFLRQSQSSAERVVDGIYHCIGENFGFIPTLTNFNSFPYVAARLFFPQ